MRTTFYTLLALSLSTLTWGAPTSGNRAVHKREDLPTKICDIYSEEIPGCQPKASYGKEYSYGMDQEDHQKDEDDDEDDDDYGLGELHHFLKAGVVKRGDEEKPCAKSYQYAYVNDLKMCEEYERDSLKEKYSKKDKDAKQDTMCASTYPEAYYTNFIMCKDIKKKMPDPKNKGKDGDAPETTSSDDLSDVSDGVSNTDEVGGIEKRDDKMHPKCASDYSEAYFKDLKICEDKKESYYSTKDDHEHKKCAKSYIEAYYKQLPMCNDMSRYGDKQGKGQDGGDGSNGDKQGKGQDGGDGNGVAGLDLGSITGITSGLGIPDVTGITGELTGVAGGPSLVKRDDKKDGKMCAWSYPEAYYRHLMMCKGEEKLYHSEQDGHDYKEKKCAKDYMEAYHEKLPMCDDYYRMLQHGGKQGKDQDGDDESKDDATSLDTLGLPLSGLGLPDLVPSLTGSLIKREDKTDDTKEGKKTTTYKDDEGDVSVDKIVEETKGKVLEKVKTLQAVKDGKKAKDSDKETKDGEGKYYGKEGKKKTE